MLAPVLPAASSCGGSRDPRRCAQACMQSRSSAARQLVRDASGISCRSSARGKCAQDRERSSAREIEWNGCTDAAGGDGVAGGSAHHLHLAGRSKQAVMVAEEPADAAGDASAGSVRMDELRTLLEEIERRKPPPVALRPGASPVAAAVPYLLCVLAGWLGATIYHQERIFAPPCAVCAVSEDWLTASSPSSSQRQHPAAPAGLGLPPLRVVVVDDKKGPGANSVALHRQAFARVGMRVTETLESPYDFDLLWSHHSVNASEHSLTALHRVNHIPGMSILCQKAQFGRFAHDNRLEYVPRYYTSSLRDATYLATDLQIPGNRFVVKGRGHRGVRMMTAAEIATIAGAGGSVDLAHDDESEDTAEATPSVAGAAKLLIDMLQENLVQQFITDGLLVDGHKFDFAVYVFVEAFSPSLQAYTLENVLIRVVPKPFPTTEDEWSDNQRLIVQDEYLTPWSLPTFKRLWAKHARGTLDAFLLQTLQAGDSQEGGFTGGALSEEEAEVRVAGLWDRVRSIIRHSLQMASGTVQATMQQHRRAQQLNHQAFEFVRYDFMADRQLQPWLIEVNMSPNMIPHDGEAHQDTQWRVAILQQVAALAAGHPEAVPGATLLTGDALPATATAGGGGEQQQGAGAGAQPKAYAELRQICLDDPSWRWSCDVPAAKTPSAFSDECECSLGRLVQHKETKHYRCERLGPECGGVSFEATLGYSIDWRWYGAADGSPAPGGDQASGDSCGAK